MAHRQSHTLKNAIDAAKRILVVGDGRPDGDSIGASTALFQLFRSQQKDVHLFCITPAPSTFSFIQVLSYQKSDASVFDESWDLIITVDGGDLAHIGIDEYLRRTPEGYTLINIDHHSTNTQFGHINFVDTLACSTCEVIFSWCEDHEIEIDSSTATSLLLGIMTDTFTFHNSGTNETGMRAAAELCKLGAKSHDIIQRITMNKHPEGLRIWGLLLQRLRLIKEYNTAYTYITQDDLDNDKDLNEALESMPNFLNAVCAEADTTLVLRELPNGQIKGSFRSHNKDVAKVCQVFGGGGHKKAAGFVLGEPFELNSDGEPKAIERIKLALA